MSEDDRVAKLEARVALLEQRLVLLNQELHKAFRTVAKRLPPDKPRRPRPAVAPGGKAKSDPSA